MKPTPRLFVRTLATLAILGTVAAGSAAGGPLATSVSVRMTDFKFALSKRTVPRGVVAFKLVNRGFAAHDMRINRRKSPLYKRGEGGIFRVTFRRAGRYPYICTVPGHVEAGMKGVLIVR